MDEIECISYEQSGFFSTLITDYLKQKENLKPFYNRFPSIENFEAQLQEKSSFNISHRNILADRLLVQYASLVDKDISLKQIESLRESHTFTITTGHQLNICTGPLYFIYKIVSAINLCKSLAEKYPQHHFVPVYWMATEDHDFAEINHFNTSYGRLSWEREAGGPVGRFSNTGMEKVLEEIKRVYASSNNRDEILGILEKAYLGNSNLAEATRYIVHHLFAKEGLIIVDGDDAALKQIAMPYFKKDIFENQAEACVARTSEALSKDYFQQVHPREINMFYIKDGLRERMEKQGDIWVVLETDISFTKESLEAEMENYPERFSPNVILRPLYQEVILPNLAYIGGGGELAYWFQLKDMFSHFEVPFPMLVLRNSVMVVSKKQEEKWQKLGFTLQDWFKPLEELKTTFVKSKSPVDPSLDPHEEKLEQMFNDLEEVAKLTDKSMLGAVNAQRQKQLNGLKNLRKKLIRAEKRRQSDALERIEQQYKALFPNGLQERHANLIAFYHTYGYHFIEVLLKQLKPLEFEFTVLKME